jgi:hypothetical protein
VEEGGWRKGKEGGGDYKTRDNHQGTAFGF